MSNSLFYARLSDVDIDHQFCWYDNAVKEWKANGYPDGEFIYRVPQTNIELVIHSVDAHDKYAWKKWRIRLCS